MQVTQQKDLGERIRYYQSKIVMDSLGSGNDYGNIKDSYIIFLCPFDPIGYQLRRYTLELHPNEEPSLTFSTGAKVVLLNSVGKIGKVTPDLSSFFSLMNGMTVKDNKFGKQISRDIAIVKIDPVKGHDFMDMALKMYDACKAGLEKGLAQGLEQGFEKGLERGLRQGQMRVQTEGKLRMAASVAKNLKSKGYPKNDIRVQLQDYFSDQLSSEEIENVLADL